MVVFAGSLHSITLEVAEEAIDKSLALIPGQKLCLQCRQKVLALN